MKLNLGCGSKIYEGYVNVDKFDFYNVDIKHDLENSLIHLMTTPLKK